MLFSYALFLQRQSFNFCFYPLLSTDDWFAHDYPETLPCEQNFLSLLLIKRVSVSGIHVGSLCSFYKRNSSSVNTTKLCGLDGLSSKLYFGGRLLELSSPDKLDDPKRINLAISLLPCSSTICERTGFNFLSIFVQIICPETTGNFYSLKLFFSSSGEECGLISRTAAGNRA